MKHAFNQHNFPYLVASLLVLSMPSSVLANTYNWQGPYVGAYLGSAIGTLQMSTNAGNVSDSTYFTTIADLNAVNIAGSWTQKPRKMTVGIQAGHTWVWNQLAYGVVSDYSTMQLNSSRVANNNYIDNIPDQYFVSTSMRTNWLFTLRGRLGVHSELYLPSLIYFTGGMAISQLNVGNNFIDTSAFAGTGSSDISQYQIGSALGGGIEVAAFKHVSVNFEYLYIRLPSVKTTGTISNTEGGFGVPVQSLNSSFASATNFHANVYKIGLNYRFDE